MPRDVTRSYCDFSSTWLRSDWLADQSLLTVKTSWALCPVSLCAGRAMARPKRLQVDRRTQALPRSCSFNVHTRIGQANPSFELRIARAMYSTVCAVAAGARRVQYVPQRTDSGCFSAPLFRVDHRPKVYAATDYIVLYKAFTR